MENKNIISLLGCGWLGFPLAKYLIQVGFNVNASTSSPDKMYRLREAGLVPFLVQFDYSLPEPDLSPLLDADILIVSIPPGGRSKDGTKNYRSMGAALKKQVLNSRVSKLIFISSTSVYADNNTIVTESSEISPETASAKVIAELEESLSELPIKILILRLAGLFGPGRLPGRFFAGKSNIPNGLAPVNMIHQEDVIKLIVKLIDSETAEGIYIGCTPSHPSKQEFYTLAARFEQLEPPIFIPEKVRWKEVTSERIENELGFLFRFPSLIDRIIAS